MKISQAVIIDDVQKTLDTHSKHEIRQVIAIYFESVAKSLKEFESVVTPLGIFKKVGRKARDGRNPATGAKLKIPARNNIVFRPSKNFKEDLN